MIHRGDVVIIAQKGVYEGKPRPAVVIQSEALLADHPSILVCLIFTTDEGAGDAFYRVPIAPSSKNGLNKQSLIHVDKIATIRRNNIGKVVGKLEEAAIGRLNIGLALFQGLA